MIPNFNGKHLLEQNLPALYAALNASQCMYEVIVSDDASADDSVTFIEQNYADIRLIKNSQNGGFATNINRGIFAAKMELILLLNSDIKLSEHYFKSQLRYFDMDDTFGVMGLVVNEADGTLAEACKYPLPSLLKINHFSNIAIQRDANIYTYYLSGANALVNREKLWALKGFNELFSPFYNEDLDLSLRAWESGYKCYYQQDAACLHAVSSTIKKHHQKKYVKQIATRNKIMLHYLHLNGFRLYLYLSLTAVSLTYRWLGGKFHYYKAVLLFLQNYKALKACKTSFITEAKARQQYIPFITVKHNIQSSLNKLIN